MDLFYGSATLVRVIKLIKPIETLFFLALIDTLYFHKTHEIISSTSMGIMLVVLGTLLLLLQNEINNNANLSSCEFTFLSGITVARRNLVHKSTKNTRNALNNGQNEYWLTAPWNRLKKCAEITYVAAVPALVILAVVKWRQGDITHICLFIWNITDGSHALIFHSLYSSTSICVLSLI